MAFYCTWGSYGAANRALYTKFVVLYELWPTYIEKKRSRHQVVHRKMMDLGDKKPTTAGFILYDSGDTPQLRRAPHRPQLNQIPTRRFDQLNITSGWNTPVNFSLINVKKQRNRSTEVNTGKKGKKRKIF